MRGHPARAERGRADPAGAPPGRHARLVSAGPVALGYHPYNRCDVWRCTACRRVFLRYTEYGGYYQDERIRLVDPGLVVA